jgi:hypothetical protein
MKQGEILIDHNPGVDEAMTVSVSVVHVTELIGDLRTYRLRLSC